MYTGSAYAAFEWEIFKFHLKVLYKTNSFIFVRVFQMKSITTIYSKVRK